jgi:MoxR-like ATPase
MAILLSMEPAHANPYLPKHLQNKGPTRSVVLIDELDKAPRDLPNDVLNEIENMSFTVTESGQTFAADARFRPILIPTSNSEKNLPDAFLRRCIFYHIPFPTPERLRAILQQRLAPSLSFGEQMLENAIRHFEKIRSLPLKKKPATAECLAWLQILQKMNIDVQNLWPGQSEMLVFSYAALAKTKEDLASPIMTSIPPSPLVIASHPPKPNGVGVAIPSMVTFRSFRGMLIFKTPSLKSPCFPRVFITPS